MTIQEAKPSTTVIGKHRWNYIQGRVGVIVTAPDSKNMVVVMWHTEPSGETIDSQIRQRVPINRIEIWNQNK